MKTISPFIVLIFVSILCSTNVALSQIIDFSGTWGLKEQESISGILYANGVPKQIMIIGKSDSIIIQKINVNQSGTDYTTADTVSLDGKVCETVTPQRRKKSNMIKWSDDLQGLKQSASYSYPDNEEQQEYGITDIWKLSESGKILTLIRTCESTTNDSWSIKAVYSKR